MSNPSLYSSRSRIIPEQTASDGSSVRPKVNFSKASSQKPTANRVVNSSSKVVARTKKDFWCPPGRRLSDNARVTDNRRSSIGVSHNNNDDDGRRHQSEQLLVESRSVPAAEWRRGSGIWNGRRGTNATILNRSVGSNRRPGARREDHVSPIRADSNESSLELDQRQSIDNFACEGWEENDTARESIDEIRRKVKSLLEQEGKDFSTNESEYLESESLAASDSKLILGPSEVLTGHSGQVLSLARHDGIIFSAAADGFAQAWDTHTGERLATYEGHRKPVWGLQLTGQTLITGSADGTVRFWDVETAELLHLIDMRRPVRDIALVGDALAVATSSADIDVIDLDAMMRKSTLKGHLMAVASLVSLDGGTKLASGSHDTFIRVWNPETGACESILCGHGGTVGALSVTCSLPLDNGGVSTRGMGSQIVSGSADATVRVWGRSSTNGEGWACLAVLDGHRHGVWAVHGSPFSSIFVTGGGDATVQVWAPANTISPEGGIDVNDVTERRFDEGRRMKWECVSGVRGTIGAVGAVIICEEGLFFGTSEALITGFPLKSSFLARDEGNM